MPVKEDGSPAESPKAIPAPLDAEKAIEEVIQVSEQDTELKSVKTSAECDCPGDDGVVVEGAAATQDGGKPYSHFTPGMRTYLTYLLGVTMILSTLTATIYFPLLPLLSEAFSVSLQAINLTVTVYAVCQALSPGVFASLSDCYGRRPVLLGLIALYAVGSLGLVLNLSNNYAVLMVFRAVQSLGGSPIPPLAYGIVADVSVTSQRGKMLGPMLSTCNGISAVGPVIGGGLAIVGGEGYRWVFLALLCIAALCLIVIGFTLPETGRNIVGNGEVVPSGTITKTWWMLIFLHRNDIHQASGEEGFSSTDSNKTGAKTGSASVTIEVPRNETLHQDQPEKRKWKPFNALDALRIVLFPDAALVLWTIASSYSIYYTFQVAIAAIFAENYGYNELEIGLTFLPGLTGMTIGGIVAGKLVDRNYAATAKKHGISIDKHKGDNLQRFPIEEARYRWYLPWIIAETIMVIGYGWAVYYRVHPAVLMILQFFICAISTLLSHTASALLVDIFPDTSSTAYASSQIARCGLSAASAAILQPLVDAVGRGWYFTMFGLFVGISCMLCVIMSRYKGMSWRKKRQNKGKSQQSNTTSEKSQS